jgi:hypothetical protein
VEKERFDCAVCGAGFSGWEALAEHFVAQAAGSDIAHVMWLNRHVTKFQVGPAELAVLLRPVEGRPMEADRVKR